MTSKNAGIGFDLHLPEVSKILREDNSKLQVIYGFIKSGRFDVVKYDLIASDSYKRTFSIPRHGIGGDFFVILRLSPGAALSASSDGIRLSSFRLPDVLVEFLPYHFNPENVRSPATPIPATSGEYDCGNYLFDIERQATFFKKNIDLNFEYLSLGSTWDMSRLVTENRIHGLLRIIGRTKKDVKNLSLLVFQSNQLRFEAPLAKCAHESFLRTADDHIVEYGFNSSLVGHLFEIPFNRPDLSFDTSAGSRVTLYVKAEVRRAGDEYLDSYSNAVDLEVLVSPQVASSRWYSLVDHYDSDAVGLLRTGGDKWIVPAYASYIRDILIHKGNWNINDLSKVNGGYFPGHASHRGGRDADFRFDAFAGALFDFSRLTQGDGGSGNNGWAIVLDEIESFIMKLNPEIIETVFVTKEQFQVYRNRNFGNSYDKRYVMTKFENRCLQFENGSRYISFAEIPYTRSLLTSSLDHWEHLHVRFNSLNSDGTPERLSMSLPVEDFSSLKFSIEADGKLRIVPRDSSDFSSTTKILWRYQTKKGFDSFDQDIQFGRWVSGNTVIESLKDDPLRFSANSLRYLYVTLANSESGGCIEKNFELDVSRRDEIDL